jgi:probable DNA metabolism protein
MHTVRVANFEQWRNTARALLAQGLRPDQVQWSDDEGAGLFDARDSVSSSTQPTSTLRIARELLQQLELASCHCSERRYALLYKILWRWQQGERDAFSPADEDGAELTAMIKAIKREEHDMHAYVRFRERSDDAGPRFVAWYEPTHDVLKRVGPHFAQRMGKASWMIATPRATLAWDGQSLQLAGPLPAPPSRLQDPGEALWLSYYRSIFNPARVNMRLLQSHIPSRHWKNLPEGELVPEMVKQAHAGARKIGQFEAVGRRKGSTIPIAADDAQPRRPDKGKLDECRRCELWERATQAVPGKGATHARIMLVAEQPGDQEDLAGEPLVGPAGKLLDAALAAAGVERQSLYLTNAVKHFGWELRGKRRIHKTPTQRNVDACHGWLEEELAKVGPKVVVTLGATALKAVTGLKQAKLGEMLGPAMLVEGRQIGATYHPSFVLRVTDEEGKKKAFDALVDALQLAARLAGE